MFVVDTSVAVKWVVARDESDVGQARALRKAHIEHRCLLCAPELLVFEFSNALMTGRRSSPADVAEALQELRNLQLDLRPLEWNVAERAVAHSWEAGTTVCDSYFLALALELGSTLVTADERFHLKARRFGGITLLRDLRLRP